MIDLFVHRHPTRPMLHIKLTLSALILHRGEEVTNVNTVLIFICDVLLRYKSISDSLEIRERYLALDHVLDDLIDKLFV
jgi:hypothetical protein